jgi:hypothetical protein
VPILPATRASAVAAQFAKILTVHGETGLLFSRFLMGRADLLGTDYLDVLRDVPFRISPVPRASFIATLAAELGSNSVLLAGGLHPEPCWSVPGRCAYRTSVNAMELVAQISRPLPERASVAQMAGALMATGEPEIEAVLHPRVLRQFEEWVYLDETSERERGILEVLSEMRGKSLAVYPSLIPEFCAGRVLCWTWAEGETVPSKLSDASAEVRQRIAEALLEQISFLSFVDGELNYDAMATGPDGRLILRRVGRALTVPVGRTQMVLRYIAETLSENSAAAAQSLLAEMAVVQPRLIRRENATLFVRAFEGNWRALAAMGGEVPLFLSLLHRNLIAAGNLGDSRDFLQEVQSAVLGTMLRSCVEDVMEPELAREWAAGAGMLVVDGLRTIGRMAGELRDGTNSRRPEGANDDRASAFRVRCIRQSVFASVWLVSFLVCLRESALIDQPWSGVLLVVAALAAGGLFWVVSRIG